MVPSEVLCGLLSAIQNVMWKPLKKRFPEFVQALTKEQLKDSFTKNISNDWMSICLDGSGFDSTQLAALLAAVDNVFFERCRDIFTLLLKKYRDVEPYLFTQDVEVVVDGIIRASTDLNNICFTKLPEVKRRSWP